MSAFASLIEEHAARCIELAYQCRSKRAERFLRLLAVDLMLAAEQRRRQHGAADDPLDELARLSRETARSLKSESASTA